YGPNGSSMAVSEQDCYSAGGNWLGQGMYVVNGNIYVNIPTGPTSPVTVGGDGTFVMSQIDNFAPTLISSYADAFDGTVGSNTNFPGGNINNPNAGYSGSPNNGSGGSSGYDPSAVHDNMMKFMRNQLYRLFIGDPCDLSKKLAKASDEDAVLSLETFFAPVFSGTVAAVSLMEERKATQLQQEYQC